MSKRIFKINVFLFKKILEFLFIEDYSANEKIKIPATNENHLAFTPDFSLMAVGDVKYLKVSFQIVCKKTSVSH